MVEDKYRAGGLGYFCVQLGVRHLPDLAQTPSEAHVGLFLRDDAQAFRQQRDFLNRAQERRYTKHIDALRPDRPSTAGGARYTRLAKRARAHIERRGQKGALSGK